MLKSGRSARARGLNAVIWSEDLSPGQAYDGVRVVSPFEAAG
ncbi:MAG: hypothetical protein AB1330_11190 [Bacillota bacterium]